MEGGGEQVLKGAIASLWLRGLPVRGASDRGGASDSTAPRSQWQRAFRILCESHGLDLLGVGPSQLADSLRRAGLWHEASVLEDEPRWEAAQEAVRQGRVLTPLDPFWPSGWNRLSGGGPPCLWTAGAPSALGSPAPPLGGPRRVSRGLLAVVGSRDPSAFGWESAFGAGQWAGREGWGLVTGGAQGADQAALEGLASLKTAANLPGASPFCVIFHPNGLETPEALRLIARSPWATHLSAASPTQPFTTSLAMERNLLIYAASDASWVVGPRFKQGGSWHGAVAALRAKLFPLGVAQGSGDPRAEAALKALGAALCPDLPSWINAGAPCGLQPSLFDSSPSGEPPYGLAGGADPGFGLPLPPLAKESRAPYCASSSLPALSPAA